MSEKHDIHQNITESEYAATSGSGNASIQIYNYYYGESVRIKPAESTDAVDENLLCPYRGLFHFGPDDAAFFFGREVFTEELFAATRSRNFIPVLGASGSGKSSVVFAGLVPKLQQSGHWLFTHFRPGSDPFHALAVALVPLYTPDLNKTEQIAQARQLAGYFREATVPLADVFALIHQNNPKHQVLLIADQFEELYTLCGQQEIRHSFLDTLLASFQTSLAQSEYNHVLVTTMRADFLGNALLYPPFGDVLKTDIKLIRSMNYSELEQVIIKPAEKSGVTFEAGLVERILNDVNSQPGNLPLLEFGLTQLWKQRKGKQLTHAAYQEIGEIQGALARHASQHYDKLNTTQKEQVRRIFIQLVRPGEGTEDTRRLATKAELGGSCWGLVKQLADARLVVTSRNATDCETVEVVHEALIREWGILREWMETDRDFRAWQERLRATMHQWEDKHKDDGALLHGALLIEAQFWQQQRLIQLSEEERIFIHLSLALRDKEQTEREKLERKARRLLELRVGGLSILLALTTGIIAYPYVLSWIARGKMVNIPAASVIIGTNDQEAQGNEKPEWKTNLPSFYLEKFEVSNHQYRLCVQAGKCTEPLRIAPLYYDNSTNASNHPVVGVTAQQAFDYCRWIGRRLPTELEWERAARGAEGRLWPWGNEPPTRNRTNILFEGEPEGTKPVQSYPKGASPEGVFNLVGNVWEWTASYGQKSYSKYDQKQVWDGDGRRKNLQEDGLVRRGGGWQDTHRRVSAKAVTLNFDTNNSVGIRCASD